MASVNNVLTTANGWFKDVFGASQDARPEGTPFLDKVKFNGKKKLGQQFSEPVWLTDEHGFTYDSGAGTAFTLNSSEAAVSAEATLSGAEIVLRARTSYKFLAAAVNAGEASFGRTYARVLANMRKSFDKRLETTMMYGGTDIGAVSTVTVVTTTATITLTEASWMYGAWTGSINAPLDFHDVTGNTQLNTNALVRVTGVDVKNRKLTVSGNAADLTTIATAATDGRIYWDGAQGAEGNGVRFVANLSSGSTYLGIAAATYEDLWTGNQVTVSGNLTWDKIQDGLEEAAGKGCEGTLCLMVPLPAWSNLNSDISALRAIDSGYSKSKQSIGTESIEYHSVTGRVEVIPSRYVKNGEAIAFPKDGDCKRVGSTDVTFELPDKGGEFFRHVEDAAAVELRAYSDQAYWTTDVKDHIIWTGFTN